MKTRMFLGRFLFCSAAVLNAAAFFFLIVFIVNARAMGFGTMIDWDIAACGALSTTAAVLLLVRAAFSIRQIDTFVVWAAVRMPFVLILAWILYRIRSCLTYRDGASMLTAALIVLTGLLVSFMTPLRKFFGIGSGSRYS